MGIKVTVNSDDRTCFFVGRLSNGTLRNSKELQLGKTKCSQSRDIHLITPCRTTKANNNTSLN